MSLDGKIGIITGGSRGIGLACAQTLIDRGARVAITGRDADTLAEAVEQLGAEYSLGIAGKADDPAHRAATVATVIDRWGSVDLLVNNAGVNPHYGTLLSVDPRALRKIFDVNVFAALDWTRAVCEAGMLERGGAIVNMSSITGLRAVDHIAAYGVSKAALSALTEQLATELAPRVRVNAVAPGVVKTQFAAALYEGRERDVAAAYPLARLGVPEDVAGAVAFLLSDDAGWITGQTLTVDGGVTLKVIGE